MTEAHVQIRSIDRLLQDDDALAAFATVAAQPSNLEFAIDTGKRGDRDAHVESLLKRLSGAEAVTVVNA